MIDLEKINRSEMIIRMIRMNRMRYKREMMQMIKDQNHRIDSEAPEQNKPSDNPIIIEPLYIYMIFTSSQFTKIVIIPNCI